MRILFDIGHPGHVHLFKNLAHLFIEEGVEILFTTRDKECELDLLKSEGFTYKNMGKHYKKLYSKIWGLLKFDTKMYFFARKFKPDLFISHGSIYAAHSAFLLGKKHLSLEDSGNMEQILLYRPFTETILTPEVLQEELGKKQIRYNGYHELAYLHPEFFQPDETIYSSLGLEVGEPYAIVRFVSWDATHDIGKKGISNDDKLELVKKLSKKMKVFISAEADISDELKPYLIKIAPEKFHHVLYFATIVVSEGATIASEAGVLGTPAIYINSIERSYCIDQEKYGLVFNTTDSKRVFSLIDEILNEDQDEFQIRRKKLLSEKINVTRYLYDFVVDKYMN